MTDTARSVALRVLNRIEADGAYANLALAGALARTELSTADRRFATDLVYGTTRMRRACDVITDRFVTVQPDPATRNLLRLGAYQLAYGRVAAHAAVSETVNLATRRTAGFINAVLRKVAGLVADGGVDAMSWPSEWAQLSYPDWIGERLTTELGADAAVAALMVMNTPPAVTVRLDGYVQDASSQWVAAGVEATADERVADVCAAPGGKATALAQTGARVFASDRNPARLGLVVANDAQLGAGLYIGAADATSLPYRDGEFDAVLVDAPCSGLGAMRRRPDARWRITANDLDQLARLQQRILLESARVVGPRGRLVYSVCTLTAQESIDLAMPDGFAVDPTPPSVGRWTSYGPGWRVLPQDADTDGMIMIRYRRLS